MKKLPGVLLLSIALTASACAAETSQPADPAASSPPTASYLMAGAPTFDMTIAQFREKFNASYVDTPLLEFRAINSGAALTRAASKINETLYASTALEAGTGKIKTLQITWLPLPGPDEKVAQAKAMAYMTALLRFFEPGLTAETGRKKLDSLLTAGKGERYFARSEGALRFVVSDSGDKGLTLAIEPIKLTLPPTNSSDKTDQKQSQ